MNQKELNNLSHDDKLWYIARKRIEFKHSFVVYLVVNAFLWLVWLFTSSSAELEFYSIPWPIYPMFGWGLGLAINYVHIPSAHKKDPIEQEYEKLKSSKSEQ